MIHDDEVRGFGPRQRRDQMAAREPGQSAPRQFSRVEVAASRSESASRSPLSSARSPVCVVPAQRRIRASVRPLVRSNGSCPATRQVRGGAGTDNWRDLSVERSGPACRAHRRRPEGHGETAGLSVRVPVDSTIWRPESSAGTGRRRSCPCRFRPRPPACRGRRASHRPLNIVAVHGAARIPQPCAPAAPCGPSSTEYRSVAIGFREFRRNRR